MATCADCKHFKEEPDCPEGKGGRCYLEPPELVGKNLPDPGCLHEEWDRPPVNGTDTACSHFKQTTPAP